MHSVSFSRWIPAFSQLRGPLQDRIYVHFTYQQIISTASNWRSQSSFNHTTHLTSGLQRFSCSCLVEIHSKLSDHLPFTEGARSERQARISNTTTFSSKTKYLHGSAIRETIADPDISRQCKSHLRLHHNSRGYAKCLSHVLAISSDTA